LVSFRPEFFPPWLDESHVTLLTLNRLAREQISAIILDVAGSKELPSQLHEQIISKADGIPLFAEELTKTVLESERSKMDVISTSPLICHHLSPFRRRCWVR